MVGNPANTNCLIAMNNAPDIPRERFTSMMRLDHNRAIAQLAAKLAVPGRPTSPRWACGATTRRPCTPTCSTPRCAATQAAEVVDDQAWIEDEFLPNVGKRGAAVIEARGASSAASAANAAIDHVRDWVAGTERRAGSRWASPPTAPTASPRASSAASPAPARAASTRSSQGLDIDEFSRAKIDASVAELIGERDTVAGQGLI